LTPVLIIGASLAGRRFGGVVSGWLVGLPLTSGPIAAFLAVEQGPRFAARRVGSLSGAAAEGAFCIAYGRLAQRGIVPALAAGTLAFAALGGASVALHGRDRRSSRRRWSPAPSRSWRCRAAARRLSLRRCPRAGTYPRVRSLQPHSSCS
jgi:hypothetical protein